MTAKLNGLCVVEISADYCASCHTLLPYLNRIARDSGLNFVRIDLEENPDAAEKFSVDRVPAVLLCDGEKVFAKCYGFQPEEILELWIQSNLEEYKRSK